MKRRFVVSTIIICLALSLVLAGVVLRNLARYNHAGPCGSSTSSTSATCVEQVNSVVVRQLSRDISSVNEASDILHGVVLDYTGGTCNLWMRNMPTELTPQANVVLLRWNGRCIGIINSSGERQYSYYWEPGLTKVLAVWIACVPLCLGLLLYLRKRATTPSIVRCCNICLMVGGYATVLIAVILVYAATDMSLL
jgi:hypothetical protein